MPRIIPIVEGAGDVEAVPLLLRRILQHRQWWHWSVATPKKGGNLNAPRKKLGAFIQYGQREKDCGGILILLDLDDGCPKHEALALADQVRQLNPIYPVAIVLAHREYEAWFLTSLAPIAGNSGLPQNLVYEGDVEGKRDVKGWLTTQMPPGQAYKPTIHQASFTNLIDLDLAQQRSRSFRRLLHAVEELMQITDTTRTQECVTPSAST